MHHGTGFDWHSDRARLLREAHARPSTRLEAADIVIGLANVWGQEAADSDRRHRAIVRQQLGGQVPDRGRRWWALEGPGCSPSWEHHR